MGFLAVKNIKDTTESKCTLYVFKFILRDGKVIYKVGITCVQPIDRMLQVLRSFYMAYRYIPEATMKRFRKVDDHFEKETLLHREFKEYQCTFEKHFDGYSELFEMCEDTLLNRYDEITKCPSSK